jgi:hypothetical protein
MVDPSEKLDSFTLGFPEIGLTMACEQRRALLTEDAQLTVIIAIITKDC